MAISTALTVVVLALQLYILKTTDETFRVTNRAYVFLRDIALTGIAVGNGVDWAVIPQWVNGGNTTTKEMKMRTALLAYDNPAIYLRGFTRCDPNPKSPTVPVVLGPKQTSTTMFYEAPSTPFKGFQDGTFKKLYMFGWARYFDQFSDKQRVTRFCFDIQRVVGNPADANSNLQLLHGLCTEGNCTDNECEKEDEQLASKMPAIELFCNNLNRGF